MPESKNEPAQFSEYTVIIPVLNEVDNVAPLAKEILSLYPGIFILFSDDGSTDGTRGIVRKLEESTKGQVMLLDRSNEPVKGNVASVVHAIEKCSTRFFIVMDGDFQHPPDKVGEIISEFKRSSADIVICSRRSTKDWSILRRLISSGAHALGSFSLMLRGSRQYEYDIMSGFFGMDKSAFEHLDIKRINLHGYKLLFDILKQIRSDAKISEIKYDFGKRKTGVSKINALHILSYCKSLVT